MHLSTQTELHEKKPLILIGGGGHCRSCIDVVEAQNIYQIVGILDSANNVGKEVSGYIIVGTDNDIDKYISKGYYFLITIGQIKNSEVREKIYNNLIDKGAKLATVISPYAYVSKNSLVEKGSIIMHFAMINSQAKVKCNCIINSRALIEHDAEIREHCHVSTGALVNGAAIINRGSFCGSGSIIIERTIVPPNSFIKAGTRFKNKTRSKTAFLTTLFPLDNNLVEDFMTSLVNQTTLDFDLIIVNDSYGDLTTLRAKYNKLNIIELPSSECIAQNRASLISFSQQNGYEHAIFGDIDDYFSDNRVEVIIKNLQTTDIVVNDFTIFNSEGIIYDSYLSNRFNNLDLIGIEDILDKNIFGFTNSALNLNIIKNIELKFEDDLIAVDWYFFSKLLLMGFKARFCNDTNTYYRQHENNIVGINNEKNLQNTLNAKILHYREMRKHSEKFNPLYGHALALKGQTLNHAIKKVKFPLWWENIQLKE